MPCRDELSIEEEARDEAEESTKVKAALCAVLSVLGSPQKRGKAETVTADGVRLHFVLNRIDWREAGITRKWLMGWWAKHSEEDEERRKREKVEREERSVRLAGYLKLTPTERKALGVTDPRVKHADEEWEGGE